MLILKIVLSIVGILTVLTFVPIYVDVKFEEKFDVALRYLFVKINLFRKEKKEIKPSAEKTEKKSTIKTIKDTIKTHGLSDFINMLKKIAELVSGALRSVFSHVVIDNMYLDMIVASDNAANTAINYGYTCASIFPSVNMITDMCKCKKKHVQIKPSFDDNNTKIKFLLKFHIRPIFAIIAAISAFVGYIKWALKTKLKESN